MKVLITGSNGLLGQKIIHRLREVDSISLIATSRGENRVTIKSGYKYISLDISNFSIVEKVLFSEKPDIIINTAAMTNVDKCEDNIEECDLINVKSVENLLRISKKLKSHFIHISTDFIFDGNNGPYSEDDIPNPLSYYGLSKLKSENILLNSDIKWTIIRTIVVYGVAENLSKGNIVVWAKKALENGDPLHIIDDHFRSPTLAEDLAEACVLCFTRKKYGIFHVSGKEIMSIYKMVKEIADYYGYSTNNLHRITSDTLDQKAKRPRKSGFYLQKSIKELGYNPHSFKEGLSIIDKQLN
tara:strand:+ start:26275 stop:27171 length:897 start_codon:yes stop_codon:yes gene_type:complete